MLGGQVFTGVSGPKPVAAGSAPGMSNGAAAVTAAPAPAPGFKL
jgi:hypothetical protein